MNKEKKDDSHLFRYGGVILNSDLEVENYAN